MSLTNIKISRIDELYDIVEAALDEKARANELIETDAVGQSMRPTIVSGDRIVIDRMKIDELKAGDIIAFGKGSLLICHRIKEAIERNGRRYFITIGDAYEKADNFEVDIHEVAGKVVKVIKPGARLRIYSYLKRALKAILRRLGVYNLSKKIFFKAVRNRLEYLFSIPREKSTHPANRFIDVPLEYIEDGAPEFFAPLDSIGGFRILASLGKARIASVEVYKFKCDKHRNEFWAVSNLWAADIFCGSGLEEEMRDLCRFILEKIGVEKLVFNSDRPIFLPFPTVFQEVSFIHGGLIDELSCRGHKIVILVDKEGGREKFRRFFRGRGNITVEAASPEIPKWKRLLFGIIPGALSYKNIDNLAPITRKRIEKNTGFVIKLFSRAVPEPTLIWLQNAFLTSMGYDRLFLRYKPSLVLLSDSGNIALNRYLPRSARKFDVPVIAVEQCIDDVEICSWLPKLDMACVWGEDMKKELMRYHSYPEDNISVIGLLRGDMYKEKSLLMKRDEFFQKYGLDPDKKLITITTKTCDPKIFCDMVKSILRYSAEGRVPFPIQIYIRPKPYQYGRKNVYQSEFSGNPMVHVGETFLFGGEEAVSKEAAGLLVNLIRYSDVLINILGTMTLEACLVDTPVINAAFKENDWVFDYEYAKRLMATGGTSVVRDMPELIEALNLYLKNPGYKREGRKEIVARFCHSDDGNATKRALEIIESYL